jgi:hypothetical protein
MAQSADLDLLRQRLRPQAGDQLLAQALDVSTAWVVDRVYPQPDASHGGRHPEVTEAILLLAHRLYKRLQSPEGVAGWGDLGVVRILGTDPDIERLLERHLDYSKAGLA